MKEKYYIAVCTQDNEFYSKGQTISEQFPTRVEVEQNMLERWEVVGDIPFEIKKIYVVFKPL